MRAAATITVTADTAGAAANGATVTLVEDNHDHEQHRGRLVRRQRQHRRFNVHGTVTKSAIKHADRRLDWLQRRSVGHVGRSRTTIDARYASGVATSTLPWCRRQRWFGSGAIVFELVGCERSRSVDLRCWHLGITESRRRHQLSEAMRPVSRPRSTARRFSWPRPTYGSNAFVDLKSEWRRHRRRLAAA